MELSIWERMFIYRWEQVMQLREEDLALLYAVESESTDD